MATIITPVATLAAGETEAPTGFQLAGLPAVTVGRDPSNNLVLANPQISRQHAQIRPEGNRIRVTDLNSTHGTFVNGERITSALVGEGDNIQFGPYRYQFVGTVLHRMGDVQGTRIDCVHLTKTIPSGVRLIDDVTFTVLPREFVALVGGSGAGKSTLLDAVNGNRPANGGSVLYNGADYYREIDAHRSSLGYVPQDDVVPMELTVERALLYAAKLRLPEDMSEEEIRARIDEVLDDLGLIERRDVEIRALSGGQRKRVSIGAELLSKPTLLFMDEPTSGLDPGLESRMMHLLRKLADQGRTVMLITHATQSIGECDRVLFLARGGRLAYYGPPDEALGYFGVGNFAEIYNRLEQERTPAEWAESFQQSAQFVSNVQSRLTGVAMPGESGQTGALATAKAATPAHSVKRVSPLRQFQILTSRYLETIYRDRKNLALLLAQAPIIGLMLAVVFRGGIFDPTTGDRSLALTLTFLLVTIAVWFGTSNSAREIVKEAAIYHRERRVSLMLFPYVASKLVVLTGLCAVQNLVLVLVVAAFVGLESGRAGAYLFAFLTLMLISLGGIGMGLLISVLATNSDRAMAFVPVVLIPQIIFSGAIVSPETMGVIGRAVSHLMVAKWGYQALGAIVNLDLVPVPKYRIPDFDKLNLPPEQLSGAVKGLSYSNREWFFQPTLPPEFPASPILPWLMLGLFIALFLSAIVYFQRRKDRVS
ncbi:MAG: ATP-binding cassette domain-containing protein [Chloroflexi bacterium]|nr:ATP-binding cassette domain-containing protein [Chloroflexota bacterium]